MDHRELFVETLGPSLAIEFRRQAMINAEEWVKKIERGVTVVCTSGAQQRRDGEEEEVTSTITVEVDMTGMEAGDKVFIALVESLVKLSSAQFEPPHAAASSSLTRRSPSVGQSQQQHSPQLSKEEASSILGTEWHVLVAKNALTDRSVRHVVLLVQCCTRVTHLDLQGNHFTEEGCAELLNVLSNSPCDVLYDMHRGGGSAAFSPVTSLGGDAAAAPENKKDVDGGDAAAAPSETQSPTMAVRRLQRSPSVTSSDAVSYPKVAGGFVSALRNKQRSGAGDNICPSSASSLATSSRVSFFSGSAEALRKRREELFGKEQGAEAAEAVSPPQPQPSFAATAAAPQTSIKSAVVEPGASSTTEVSRHRAASAGAAQPPPPSPPLPAATQELSGPIDDEEEEEERHRSLNRNEAADLSARAPSRAQSSLQMQGEEEEHEGEHYNSRAPYAGHHSVAHTISKDGGAVVSPRQKAHQRYPQPDEDDEERRRGDPVQREPFERNDQLDVTANLNPLLDCALDLGGVAMAGTGSARGDGRLRKPEDFGGATSLWNVVKAYENAVEETSFHGGDVSQDTAAKLPTSILSGRHGHNYSALTVLNISHNHLSEIHVLPASLLRLDVSNNNLTRLSGLWQCKMLAVLNARRNKIQAISGLEKNLCMAHLFLGHNQLKFVEGLAHLMLLETLDLTHNELRTQSSIRALSLCSGLRHLLLKGNPVIAASKAGGKPLLRNLCPTLLVLDNARLGPSRMTDLAQSAQNWLRQPNMIDSTFQRSNTASNGGGSGYALHPAAAAVPSTYSRNKSSSRVDASRATTMNRTAYGFTSTPQTVETAEQQSMNLLHLLTRGVTAPTGYGDSAVAANTARNIAQRAEEQQKRREKKKLESLTEGGQPLRAAMMKRLAEESKRYLETTIVERMTMQGATIASTNPPVGGGAQTLDSPVPDILGYSATPPAASEGVSVEDVLKPYVPSKFRAPPSTAAARRGKTATPVEPEPMNTEGIKSKSRSQGTDASPSLERNRTSPAAAVAAASMGSREGSRRQQPLRRSPSSGAHALNVKYPQQQLHQARKQETENEEEAFPEEPTLDAIHVQDFGQRSSSLPQRTTVPSSYSAIYRASRQHVDPSGGVGGMDDFSALDARLSPIREPGGGGPPSANTSSTHPFADEAAALSSAIAAGAEPRGGQSSPPPRPSASALRERRQPSQGAAGGTSSIPRRSSSDANKDARSAGASRGFSQPQQQQQPKLKTVVARDPAWMKPKHLESRGEAHAKEEWNNALTVPPSLADVIAQHKTNQHHHYTGGAEMARSQDALYKQRVNSAGGRKSLSPYRAPATPQPLRTDVYQKQRVQSWRQELDADVRTVQGALRSTVELLRAQRHPRMAIPESARELPPTYLQERDHCMAIIDESSMLKDTEIPMEVVLYYGLGKDELDSGSDKAAAAALLYSAETPVGERSSGAVERADVLRQVRLLGDAKTCLKYMMLLIGDGKERVLQKYVDQVKDSL